MSLPVLERAPLIAVGETIDRDGHVCVVVGHDMRGNPIVESMPHIDNQLPLRHFEDASSTLPDRAGEQRLVTINRGLGQESLLGLAVEE